MLQTSNVRWAVAITEPNRDAIAEQSLRREGYRVIFLYRRKLLTGHRGDWRTTHAFVTRPLFEGYGFVQLWPSQEWPNPTRTTGFTGLLGGDNPVCISEDKILDWQSRTWAGKFDDRLPERPVKSGAKFHPANSEAERQKVLAEFMEKLAPQYAAAS